MNKIYLSTAAMLLSSSLVLGADDTRTQASSTCSSSSSPATAPAALPEYDLTASSESEEDTCTIRALEYLGRVDDATIKKAGEHLGKLYEFESFNITMNKKQKHAIYFGETWEKLFKQAGLSCEEYDLWRVTAASVVVVSDVPQMISLGDFEKILTYGHKYLMFNKYPKHKLATPTTESEQEITSPVPSLLQAEQELFNARANFRDPEDAFNAVKALLTKHPEAADCYVFAQCGRSESGTYRQLLQLLTDIIEAGKTIIYPSS